jgi:hypothetical protein
MGEDMLANHRAFLDVEQLVKVMGVSSLNSMDTLQGMYTFLNVTKEDLQGEYDFIMYDGTLPSEKQQNAVALQELFNTLASNPELAQVWGYTPEALHTLYMEILKLRGISDAIRYRLSAQQSVGAGQGPVGDPQGSAGPVGQEPSPMLSPEGV